MTEATHNISLTTRQLTVGYRKGSDHLEILKHLHLSLAEGELICFMGPNGIGKSTLIRTLCGMQPALDGEVLLHGKPISTLKPSEVSKLISVVLTDHIAALNMTVHELVMTGRYPYLGWSLKPDKTDQVAAERAIAQTSLKPILHLKLNELSDGQLQKAMIARALCQDTPILILDEPTAHLDLNNRVEIITLLKDLARQNNKAILMATHELDLTLQAADVIWLADHDQSVITGFPEDLVLSGAIDKVFGLKGYDLRTGTLHKHSFRGKVSLIGDGHLYLWTKNALERNGYEIQASASQTITVETRDNRNHWSLIAGDKTSQFYTLQDLVETLMAH